MTAALTLRCLITITLLTTMAIGFPIGHHSKGLSTTCAYFSWILCDTPKKSITDDLTKKQTGEEEQQEEEGNSASMEEGEMKQHIEKSLVDLQIEHIRKYVLNEILDSKNMTLPEKERLLDEVLQFS